MVKHTKKLGSQIHKHTVVYSRFHGAAPPTFESLLYNSRQETRVATICIHVYNITADPANPIAWKKTIAAVGPRGKLACDDHTYQSTERHSVANQYKGKEYSVKMVLTMSQESYTCTVNKQQLLL